MPFIISRTTCSISHQQEVQLKQRIGKAIELVPGKSEQYLLLGFEDNCRLWLRGDNSRPIVYVEAAIWGNELHHGYDQFAAELTRIFHEVLGVAPDSIYIRFSDIPDWSVAGMNFDRNKYM